MEFINRIILRGIVGTAKIQQVQGLTLANFTVVTEYAYRNRGGKPTIDTTWHNVHAFEGKNICLEGLEKGALVEVEGRLRAVRYTDATGADRTTYEVAASKVSVIDDGKHAQAVQV